MTNQFTGKALSFALIALAISAQAVLAGVPQGINYQAIARNASGLVIPNTTITVRLTITNGSGGSTLYTETDTVNTNQFGLFTLEIGIKDTTNFSAINWGGTTPWLKVEMDPAGHASFVLMGSSQLLSVPYALYAAHGTQGPPGNNGANGATWYTGAGTPSAGTGVVNDLYLNTTTGDYYKKTGASTWTIQGNLTGGQGPPGNNGTPGTNGINGATWYTGAGAPAGGTGTVNDLYLNTSTGDYYKKTGASTWTLQGNLTGPAGTYIAGSGISIVGNTISATGGGTLGQSSTTSYSTSQITLDPLYAGTYTLIPGTSQTINVPANCTVNISTYGGIQNLGIYNGDFAAVDIALGVDGNTLANAGIQYVFVPNSTSIGQTIENWSFSQSGTISPGSHVFAVYATWDADSGVQGSINAVPAHVGSSQANSVLRSVLTITIIKN